MLEGKMPMQPELLVKSENGGTVTERIVYKDREGGQTNK